MPRRGLTLEEKSRNAEEKLQEILNEYSIEFLLEKRYDYRQNKNDEELKRFNALYRKVLRYKKIIEENRTLSLRINRQRPSVNDNNNLSDTCDNCKRQYHEDNNNNNIYKMNLSHQEGTNINNRKFKDNDVIRREDQLYTLCDECNSYLSSTNEKSRYDSKIIWPVFIWFILKDPKIHECYGNTIWKFIPSSWRQWWLMSLKNNFPTVYSDISIDYPPPIFNDVTNNIKEWNDDIDSYLLSRLAKTTNKFPVPTVKCPWGCSEFIHKVGYLPIDTIFQRYLQYCEIKTIQDPKYLLHKNVLSAREDYIRLDVDDDDDMWLFNPEWKIKPTIAYVEDKGPCVLTCNEHDKGTKLFMIHSCRWKHNLPSARSDQLCQAVIQPRTLKPIQASKYSMSFQMFQQSGSFNGIDTCSAVSYGNFDFKSKLLDEAEARSIKNRPDINAHLTKLRREKIISEYVENGKRQFAQEFASTIDYSKYINGAMYVSLETCMTLQKETTDRKTKAVIDNRENTRPIEVNFNTFWSSSLYPCQTTNSHGVMFVKVPTFSNNIDTQMIWIVATLIVRVEPLWKIICEVPLYTSEWYGWMLAYLSKNCFNYGERRQGRYDPFKFVYINKVERLLEKVPIFDKVESYFCDIDEIFCCDASNEDEIKTELSNEDLSIISIIIVKFKIDSSTILPELIDLDRVSFELRTIVSTSQIGDDKWTGFTYSRHGGVQFHSWWYDEKNQSVPIKVDEVPNNLPESENYTLVYVKINEIDIDSIRNQFLKSLGGQTHVQCSEHKLPLIASTERKNKCIRCFRKDYYRCVEFECRTFICKHCFDRIDRRTVTCISSSEDEAIQNMNENDHDVSSQNNEEEHNNDNIDEDFQVTGHDIDGQEEEQNITEVDDIDNFLINTADTDFQTIDDNDMDTNDPMDYIPTTNAGQVAMEINEQTKYGGTYNNIKISGHVLLNQCGTLLTRKKHQIKGSSAHHFFLQRICATKEFSCVPLVYPEGVLFPSIHWYTAPDKCSIVGCIPAPLLTESIRKFGFASIPSHVRTRLTFASSATSTDPRYCSHCYDMLTNLSANHEDTRLILNRGLTVADDDTGGLKLRGKEDSCLTNSVDNKQMVRNLCMSQKYFRWDHFCTYTCNMKSHFGTAPIKNWIDSGEWKNHYPSFELLDSEEKKEIYKAILHSSAALLLRIWEEVFLLFINYLRKSKSSPFKKLNAIFARKEYQKLRGNLSHCHLMIQLKMERMTVEEKNFVDDIIRAGIFDLVRSNEIQKFIDDGIFEDTSDIFEVYDNAASFLPHRCNDSCLVKKADGEFRCRKIDNVRASNDNTSHQYMDLPNNYSVPCLKILERIGLTDELEIDSDGNVTNFRSWLSFFHPLRHVPPTNPTNDMNISPVDGYTFAVCKSMQNVQRLTGTGGCSKYVCKYISKIDEQNYVVIEVNGEGRLVTKSTFLHNTKISSSKMAEDKAREKDHKKPQGFCISHLEMLHNMLKYPEVVTNLDFIKVPTMPLELRTGIVIESDKQMEDGAFISASIASFRRQNDMEEWRLYTNNQLLILDDIKLSNLSVDKVTQFSLRPPELLQICDKLGDYYRWFHISKRKIKVSDFPKKLNEDIYYSCWIDGLQRQIRLRKKAIAEIVSWCEKLESESTFHSINERNSLIHMIPLIYDINDIYQANVNELNTEEEEFYVKVYSDFLFDDEKEHLPIPVFSYIIPTMGTSFLLHIMLSMGRFETEIDLTMHATILECLRSCGLVGCNNDTDSLKRYADELLHKFIIEQVQYFPNSQRVIDFWIIAASQLFHSVIVEDELPVTEIPPVQLSKLMASTDGQIIRYAQKIKTNLINCGLKEMGTSIETCGIPSKEELENATFSTPLNWDAIASFRKYQNQTDESYQEQKLAIETSIDAIDSYRNTLCKSFVKHVGILGFPGGGKTWCMMYCLIYSISCGLKVTTAAMMCNRALQLGGIHVHKLFNLPTERLTPHRRAELAIIKLMKCPKRIEFLRSIDVIFFDEMGQVSSEFLATFDIILRRIRNSNIYMGGVLFIFSMDHTQIQPIEGHPFLTSCHIIPCYKMVVLSNSVRAHNDPDFKRIQEIARYNYKKIENNPELINEFIRLCSEKFTFIERWDDDNISPSTMRLYSKRVPAREAAQQFVQRVERQINCQDRLEKTAEDVVKSRYSHQDWTPAPLSISVQLEQKLREPKKLIFFKGAVFEITFNEEGKFSNTQTALLFDLPSQDDLDNWRKIKVLKAPLGIKDIEFDINKTKEMYLNEKYEEIKIGIAPQRTQILSNNCQAKRKQYGLKHRVTSTIHAAMGDTLSNMATEISRVNANFKMWDKGQMIVILSRTKYASKTIFVGDKNDTLKALKDLLTRKTQWTDFMEEILRLITINNTSDNHTTRTRTFTQQTFPYRVCDVSLPQCNTGYVYMLLSIKDQNFTYIGKTNNIRTRIQQHNSGLGSISTEPLHLRPYALFAYICGFDSNTDLMFYIERIWKEKRDRLIRNGVNDIKAWALCGSDVISELDNQNFGITPNDLSLVCIFD